MRWNADANFVQPSGGNILNVDHVLFVPQAENPLLPSGGMWMRANDGQVERLTVKGTSGVLECRNAEGFAFYSTTTTQDISAGPITIGSYTTIIEDERFINLSSDTVIIHVSGLHRLSYTVTYLNGTGGGAADGTVNAQILINGIKLVGSEMSAYIPIVSDGGQCLTVFYGMAILNVGDEIQIRADQLQSLGTLDVVSAILNVELIRPRGIS